jgi:hypothetical protein
MFEESICDKSSYIKILILSGRIMNLVNGDLRLSQGVWAMADAYRDYIASGVPINFHEVIENLNIGITFEDIFPYVDGMKRVLTITEEDIANVADAMKLYNG